jgi:hypothetical protein
MGGGFGSMGSDRSIRLGRPLQYRPGGVLVAAVLSNSEDRARAGSAFVRAG